MVYIDWRTVVYSVLLCMGDVTVLAKRSFISLGPSGSSIGCPSGLGPRCFGIRSGNPCQRHGVE